MICQGTITKFLGFALYAYFLWILESLVEFHITYVLGVFTAWCWTNINDKGAITFWIVDRLLLHIKIKVLLITITANRICTWLRIAVFWIFRIIQTTVSYSIFKSFAILNSVANFWALLNCLVWIGAAYITSTYTATFIMFIVCALSFQVKLEWATLGKIPELNLFARN